MPAAAALVVAALLLAPAATRPATRPLTRPSPEAAAMLDRLAAGDFAQRLRAERDLLAAAVADPSLRPAVEAAAADHDRAEVRARARTVADLLDQRDRFGATRVTIVAEDVPAREVVGELVRAVEASMEAAGTLDGDRGPRLWPDAADAFNGDAPAGDRRVSVEARDVPLWDAVRLVGGATGVWPVEHEAGFALSRQARPLGDAPRVGPGPGPVDAAAVSAGRDLGVVIELVAGQRNSNANVRFDRDPDAQGGGIRAVGGGGGGSLHLSLRVLIEPKIRPARAGVRVVVDEAVDDAGRDVRVADEAGGGRDHYWHGGGGGPAGWQAQGAIPLDAAAASESRSLSTLSGHVEIDAAEAWDRLELDVSGPVGRVAAGAGAAEAEVAGQLAGRALTLVEVRGELRPLGQDRDDRARRQSVELRLRIEAAGGAGGGRGQAEAWQEAQRLSQAAALTDAAGLRWHLQHHQPDFEAGAEGPRFSLLMTFVDPTGQLGPPATLSFAAPAATRTLRVPFEFRGVPLPRTE